MTVRARVLEEPAAGRLRVLLMDAETRMIFGPDQTWSEGELPAGSEIPESAFVLTLNYQFADVVVAALNEHFAKEKAPGDAYALRRDLDREKDRVDKLIENLITPVQPMLPSTHYTGPQPLS